MLRILGMILGFIILVLSAIGLIAVEEPVFEAPEDLNSSEMIEWDEQDPAFLPGLTAGIASGTVFSETLAAGDGPDELAETVPEIIVGAGSIIPEVLAQAPDTSEVPAFSAGIASSDVDGASKEARVSFGDGYSMQIPEGLILADGGDADDYKIMGFSRGFGPAFSIRCLIPDPALTMKDLETICRDLYGEAEYVTGEGLTYLTAYDAAMDTQMCIFPSEYSDQVYIIGMTGLNEDKPAQWYFATLLHSGSFSEP